VAKEEVTSSAEIIEKLRILLEEFKRVVHDKFPERLPPERYPISYSESKST